MRGFYLCENKRFVCLFFFSYNNEEMWPLEWLVSVVFQNY